MLRTTATANLSRQLLRSSAPQYIALQRCSFSRSLACLDQPQPNHSSSQFPGIHPKLDGVIKNSPIGRMLSVDPDVKDLFHRFQNLVAKKGFSVLKPPSKLQLGMLLLDSDFRAALVDSQALMAKHNIHPDELKKLADALMSASKTASSMAQSVTSSVTAALPSANKEGSAPPPEMANPSSPLSDTEVPASPLPGGEPIKAEGVKEGGILSKIFGIEKK